MAVCWQSDPAGNETTVQTTLRVLNRLGLHARAAAKIAAVANRFQAAIRLEQNGRVADAKNILDILCLGGSCGTQVQLQAQGPDASEAVRAITALFADLFGEL